MKKLIFILFITIFSLSIHAQQYRGTDLQGKILTFNTYYNTQVPLQYAQVDLWQWSWTGGYYQNGQQIWQWYYIAQARTDANGFYYFFGIAPNNYTIKVNQVKDYQIQVIWIDYNRFRYQDLPVLYY